MESLLKKQNNTELYTKSGGHRMSYWDTHFNQDETDTHVTSSDTSSRRGQTRLWDKSWIPSPANSKLNLFCLSQRLRWTLSVHSEIYMTFQNAPEEFSFQKWAVRRPTNVIPSQLWHKPLCSGDKWPLRKLQLHPIITITKTRVLPSGYLNSGVTYLKYNKWNLDDVLTGLFFLDPIW